MADDNASLAAATDLLGTMMAEAAPAAVPTSGIEVPTSGIPAEAAPAPEAPKEDTSLAALIRQQREDRAARVAKERQAADATAKVQELEGRLSKLSKADMLADPIGFAQAHGFSEQDMALIGQTYLYHLVPDKAPPDLRYKLLEAKTARERALDEQRRQQEAQEAAERQSAEQVQQYTSILAVAVKAWEGDAHPFPESRAWFGGNHDEYSESLVHTARNIAESARSRGEVADLSPKAVAEALERELAPRTARIRTTGSKPTQPSEKVAQTTGGKQPAVMSTRGQGASPAPPATTEAERIARAMEAAFPSR